MATKILTKGELVAMLSGIRGATFATITTETDPRLRKTGNPHSNVRKVSRVNVCIGFQYANSVNNQREREGSDPDFEAAPRQWGIRIPGTVLVKHEGSGKVYLETKVERSLDYRYILPNGQDIPEDMIAPFLPKRAESERQETAKPILVRDYAIENIKAIALKGEEYIVA